MVTKFLLFFFSLFGWTPATAQVKPVPTTASAPAGRASAPRPRRSVTPSRSSIGTSAPARWA